MEGRVSFQKYISCRWIFHNFKLAVNMINEINASLDTHTCDIYLNVLQN